LAIEQRNISARVLLGVRSFPAALTTVAFARRMPINIGYFALRCSRHNAGSHPNLLWTSKPVVATTTMLRLCPLSRVCYAAQPFECICCKVLHIALSTASGLDDTFRYRFANGQIVAREGGTRLLIGEPHDTRDFRIECSCMD